MMHDGWVNGDAHMMMMTASFSKGPSGATDWASQVSCSMDMLD